MKTETITGAACWASYLINGDSSGLEDDERKLADQWLENNEIEDVLGVGEQYFSRNYGLHTGSEYSAGELADYTVVPAREPEGGGEQ